MVSRVLCTHCVVDEQFNLHVRRYRLALMSMYQKKKKSQELDKSY